MHQPIRGHAWISLPACSRNCIKGFVMPVQDLLGWLEDSDLQDGAMPAGSPKPVNLPGAPGAAPKHQQAAEVCYAAFQ